MLKGIPKNLSPELLKILMEMGHGESGVSNSTEGQETPMP